LAALGRVRLLREYYGEVLIPPAVWKEVVEEGQGCAGVREVEEAAQSGWLNVLAPTNAALLRLLKRDLEDGEAEAIALAVEGKGDLILVDETDARRVAAVYKLPKTGVVGIILRARLDGKLASLRHELDRLRQDAGFWIAEDLYRRALETVGESVG
jgi:hypothetical protein